MADLGINRWSRDVLMKRKSIPIWHHKDEFLESLRQNQIVIVAAETGSGKTTQIPQFIIEVYNNMVGCTQPNSLSVISASRRVADEMDVSVGELVGFTLPFEDCTSPTTIINYLTDDMLLFEATIDPLLNRYKVIIIDEANQRSLATDVLLCFMKNKLVKIRPDLKLVIMSATLDAAQILSSYFDDVPPLITVPGGDPQTVQVFHESGHFNYVEAAIKTAFRLHSHEPPGDILVFVSTQQTVEYACRQLAMLIANAGDLVGPAHVVPLYSTLPPDMLHIVFGTPVAPTRGVAPLRRKIVVSTSIAETSLAVDGIVYVVDSGSVEQKTYNRHIHIEYLLVCPISKSSADLRARRAGTTRPGKCFRMYPMEIFHNEYSSQTNPPYILRSILSRTILTLKKLEINDYNLVDPPPRNRVVRELEVLTYLGALDQHGNFTSLGHLMCEFPLDPKMARMLIVSPQFNCSNEILSIAAMLSIPHRCFVDAREVNARFGHIHGDHLTLLNVYNAFKQSNEDLSWCNQNFVSHSALKSADKVRQQLTRIMNRLGLRLCSMDITSPDYSANIRKAVLAGYYMQVAHLERIGYYTTGISDEELYLHLQSSSLDHNPEWVLYNDYVSTSRNFIHTLTHIHGDWLIDIAPDYYDPSKFPRRVGIHLEKIIEARK